MKILHITPSYKPAYVYGGPIYSVSRLCESQQVAGAKVQVWTTTANGAEELDVPVGREQTVDGVGVTYFHRWTKDHTHFSPKLLWRVLMNTQQFDAIHIHSWWNLVAVGVAFLCKLKGLRPIVAPRGMLSAFTLQSRAKRLFHQYVGRWLLSGAYLHATTEAEANEINKLVPGGDCFVLPNVVELPDPRLSSSFAEEPLTEQASRRDHLQLLFLSRIHQKKGLEFLFEALAGVTFSWQLTIAGGGEQAYIDKLKDQAKRLGISEMIDWYGWADQEAKFDLLRRADLFVLTSHNENFANVVLESLAAGTPVLLSDQVGLADWVKQTNLGWVSSLDANAITSTLQTAAESREQRLRIRNEAPVIIHRTYDARAVAERYLQQYQALQAKTSGAQTTKSPPARGM